jgi:L-ascorbate metabolism protein UlaG (beta-lactamase superfamily)
LEYDRFKDLRPLIPSLIGSVRELKEKMPICSTVYDEVRDHFEDWITSADDVFDADGVRFGLIHSSSYLFNFNGYRVGMDIAFRNAWILASEPEQCVDYLKNIHLMVISHNHADHFEESLVRELANTQIRWVIPDFMYDMALEWGISPEKIYIAKKDEPITAGNLTILPFEGRHFRPGTQRGTLEYGYYVTAEGMPSIAFPVDVRDFSLENLPDIPKADYCFAHVWLGDGNGLDAVSEPMAHDFAEFMLKFSEKNIILAHLYESRKKDKYMWRREHAEFLAAKIKELSPKTNVFIPNCGQVIDLK